MKDLKISRMQQRLPSTDLNQSTFSMMTLLPSVRMCQSEYGPVFPSSVTAKKSRSVDELIVNLRTPK